MDGDVVQALVITAGLAGALASGFLRPVDEARLRRWSDRFGVPLDETTRPPLRAALRRGTRFRYVGGVAGGLVGALPAYVNLVAPERSADVARPIAGWAWVAGVALGTALAEVLLVQRPVGPRQASLERRTWRRYLPGAPVVVVAAAVTAAVVAAASARTGDAVAAAVVAVVGAAALTVGLRRVVDRPQLSPSPLLRLLDDGLRAHGAHHLAGATTATAATAAGVAVLEAVTSAAPVSIAVVVSSYAALWWWLHLAVRAVWRVDVRQPVTSVDR